MKKLFNKKIYAVVGIFVFVFIFMGLFFSINKVNADNQYYYEADKVAGATGSANRERIDFHSKTNCEVSFETIPVTLNPISHCDPNINSDSAISINPDDIQYKDNEQNNPLNYKLLAPLPGSKGLITEIKTNDIGKYFNIIFNIAIALAGGLAVVMLVLGGIQWMGSESVFGKTQGKERITSAILGLLIAIGSYTLLNTINPQLLGKNGLYVGQVAISGEIPILSDTNTPTPTGSNNSFPPECPGGVSRVNTEGGIFIACTDSVSNKLKTMIYYAKILGINLSGGGFRTKEDQIKARRNNKCPDVYNSKPTDCKPPTAKPGTSMHEKGVAFDFTCDGKLINPFEKNGIYEKDPSTEKCFVWLKNNASHYGLKNLESEPWHWSINGK